MFAKPKFTFNECIHIDFEAVESNIKYIAEVLFQSDMNYPSSAFPIIIIKLYSSLIEY